MCRFVYSDVFRYTHFGDRLDRVVCSISFRVCADENHNRREFKNMKSLNSIA